MAAYFSSIKKYFTEFNQTKLKNLFVFTYCFLFCCLTITFANDFMKKWYYIILPVFIGLLVIVIIVHVVLYYWLKNKAKTTNDLKIEKILKERKVQEKKDWENKFKKD